MSIVYDRLSRKASLKLRLDKMETGRYLKYAVIFIIYYSLSLGTEIVLASERGRLFSLGLILNA